MVVVMVVHFTGFNKLLHGISLAGGMAAQFAAGAQALVRLDVRARRHFLQVQGDGFVAFNAFERQGTGWLGHFYQSMG